VKCVDSRYQVYSGSWRLKWSSRQTSKNADTKETPARERLLLFFDRAKASFIADDPNAQYSRLDHLDGLKHRVCTPKPGARGSHVRTV
jgi:hypothetical protein